MVMMRRANIPWDARFAYDYTETYESNTGKEIFSLAQVRGRKFRKLQKDQNLRVE